MNNDFPRINLVSALRSDLVAAGVDVTHIVYRNTPKSEYIPGISLDEGWLVIFGTGFDKTLRAPIASAKTALLIWGGTLRILLIQGLLNCGRLVSQYIRPQISRIRKVPTNFARISCAFFADVRRTLRNVLRPSWIKKASLLGGHCHCHSTHTLRQEVSTLLALECPCSSDV